MSTSRTSRLRDAGAFLPWLLFAGSCLVPACLFIGAATCASAQHPPSALPAVASGDAFFLRPPQGPEGDRGAAFENAWRDPKTGIEFVGIPGGEFDMGSNAFANERPVHRVRVAQFWLARTEVTQGQWRAVMGSHPSKQRGCDDCPVEQVSWEDVQRFLQKTGYRLPAEAEWEYAAGGGSAHQRWAGTSDEAEIGEYTWHRGNSGNRSHPVCGKKPNLFGLCDMSGNVYEWCADWYGERYYQGAPANQPGGPPTGTYRVVRGGSWILDPRIAGVTFRLKAIPSRRRRYIGFRPALASDPG